MQTDILKKALNERILIIDGAMGSVLQTYKLSDADYRGDRFADFENDLKGNNDLLSLTKPDVIREVHQSYIDAGADIIETNTFNATQTAQGDYGLKGIAAEINLVGAQLAREVVDHHNQSNPAKPCFVAGVLGPTPRTASISPDVNDPAARNISFDKLTQDYTEAVAALHPGRSDLILIETIFDTLNAKAAIFACKTYFDSQPEAQRLPLMISVTFPDISGSLLSGQTPAAFWNSVAHANPLIVGDNCGRRFK